MEKVAQRNEKGGMLESEEIKTNIKGGKRTKEKKGKEFIEDAYMQELAALGFKYRSPLKSPKLFIF